MENLFKNFKSDIESEPPIPLDENRGFVDRYHNTAAREMRCFGTQTHLAVVSYLRKKGLLPSK